MIAKKVWYGLALLLAVVVASSHGAQPVEFEDIEVRSGGAWFQQDLRQRGNSMPPTTTTTATTPTGTNSAGFPTGTSSTGSGCTSSAQCQTGNCQKSTCEDTQPPGSYGCYKDQNCSTGHCVNSKCVPKDGTGKQGDKCNMSGQCTSGSFCNHSACDTQKAVGTDCYKNAGCTTGNCVAQSGGTRKCVADGTIAKGSHCNKSPQCSDPANNFCNHGSCAQKQGSGGTCYKPQGCYSGSCSARGVCS